MYYSVLMQHLLWKVRILSIRRQDSSDKTRKLKSVIFDVKIVRTVQQSRK